MNTLSAIVDETKSGSRLWTIDRKGCMRSESKDQIVTLVGDENTGVVTAEIATAAPGQVNQKITSETDNEVNKLFWTAFKKVCEKPSDIR